MTAPVTNRKILEAGGAIYVIVTKDFFENYTFQDHCEALNVQVVRILLVPRNLRLFESRYSQVNFHPIIRLP